MSQIETIMLVALGFVVAAIVALVVSRVGWSYAVKLGNRRTERDAPAKIAALQAERDQLRAEYAMLSRKLELRLDDLKTRLAEQTAEVSRNRNRVDHMVAEIQARDAIIAEREEDVRAVHEQIAPLEEELVARTQANQQLKEQVSDRDDEIIRLSGEIAALRQDTATRDRQIGELQQEIAVRPTVPELTGEAQATQTRLQERIAQLTSLSSQIEQQRTDLQAQREQFTAKQAETTTDDEEKPAKTTRKSSAKSAGKKKPAAKKSAAKKSAGKKPSRKSTTRKPRELTLIEKGSKELENQLESAEKESHDLQAELSKLDEVWSEKLEELQKVAGNRVNGESKKDVDVNVKTNAGNTADATSEDNADSDDNTPRSFQNVISLAARIRALQRKSADK